MSMRMLWHRDGAGRYVSYIDRLDDDKNVQHYTIFKDGSRWRVSYPMGMGDITFRTLAEAKTECVRHRSFQLRLFRSAVKR
jgi:hypothetical protein